jgi:O-antigen/teichoic acid export membrane protein
VRGPLARSSLRTAVMLCLRVGTQAATLVLLSRLLAPSTYGAYAAAASLAIVLGTLPSLGSGYILLSRASIDKTSVAETWRYAWPLTCVLGTALVFAYVGIGGYITGTVDVSFGVLFFLGATELVFNPLTMLLSFILQGCEKVATSQFLQWLPFLLRSLAAIACFRLESSERLSGFSQLQFLVSIVGFGVALIMTRKHVTLKWRPRLMTREELRLGSSYAAMYLVAYNPSELDKIAAVRSLGAHNAGIYTAGSRMLGAFAMPIMGLLLAAQPRLFRYSQHTHARNKHVIRIIALVSLGWGLVGTTAFVALHKLIPWLLGSNYTETGQLVPWLAITMPFLTLRMAAGGILISLGKPLERLFFELTGALVLVAGIFFLIPVLQTPGLIVSVVSSELSMAAIGWWRIRKNIKRLDEVGAYTAPTTTN